MKKAYNPVTKITDANSPLPFSTANQNISFWNASKKHLMVILEVDIFMPQTS